MAPRPAGSLQGLSTRGLLGGLCAGVVCAAVLGCEIRIADGPPPDAREDTSSTTPRDGAFDADPVACLGRDLVPCAVEDTDTVEAALRRRLEKAVAICTLAGHVGCGGTLTFHFASGCVVGLDGPWSANPELMSCLANAFADLRLSCGAGNPVLDLPPCDG